MTVLKKLTKQEKKTLKRLNDRPIYFCSRIVISDEKPISFSFINPCGEFRNFKRILAALYYTTSREKTRNKEDFKLWFSCLKSKHTQENDFSLNNKIKSNEIFSLSNLHFIEKLSKIYNSVFALTCVFYDGYFVEDEPRNINEGKIFTSDECLICLEKKTDVNFVDCGHICVCDNCLTRLCLTGSFTGKCPLCKTENKKIQKI